jgi:S1-C subfamily serine protease
MRRKHREVISIRPVMSRRGGWWRRCTAVVAVGGLLGSTCAAGSPGVEGQVTAAQVRVACTVDPVLVDIITTLAYEPGGNRASGVVIDSAGDVLTSNHVVVGAGSITLRDVTSGRRYDGTVIGTDIPDDLAVVRMAGAPQHQVATLGRSADLTIGQHVFAIGNAAGKCGTPSVVQGTVTGLDRSTTVGDVLNGDPLALSGLISSTVEVQPGYSGGALADANGQVVGILAADDPGGSDGDPGGGFAVPIDKAMAVARQMLAGITSTAVHIGPAASLGVRAASASTVAGASFIHGALVTYVAAGSPARRLAIGLGDEIVALGERPVRTARQLTELLQAFAPGDRVRLTWSDDATGRHTATAVLAAGPPQ